MARYFFTLAGTAEDDIGVDLADDRDARVQALKLAGRLLIDHADDVEAAASLRIDVTDAAERAIGSVVVVLARPSPPASELKRFLEELVSANDDPPVGHDAASTDRPADTR